MKIFLKTVWILFAAFILVGSPAIQAAQTFVYLLYDGTKVGEKNQVLGIAHALKEYLPRDIVQKEFELKEKKDEVKQAFLTDIKENLFKGDFKNKGIILTAGLDGVDVLRQFKPQKNIIIVHSSHQFTKKYAALKDVADIVALPQYVVTNEVLETLKSPQTTVIQTAGVAHNLSSKNIEETFQNNKDSIPPASVYAGIILGGDAETSNGEMRYYTAKEAEELASYIASKVKEQRSHLLILNGPRTGKHDQNTGKVVETSHRDGSIDPVTAAFKEGLQQQGLIEGKNFTVFDFQFGKTSMYPVVLGALRQTKSPIFVAGESTSMVSEAADCLPKGLVTAFTNNAMNENHRKHCFSEKEAGRINILENTNGNWQLLAAKETTDSQDSRPASQIIAEAIKKRFDEKVLQKNG